MINLSKPDLTQHPPRSPRVRLGGYVHLPRMLDKARALAAGKIGEYVYPCPLDKPLLEFLGIDPKTLLAEVKKGGSDSEILAWVNAHTKRTPLEVAAWSAWLEGRSPGSAEAHGHFSVSIKNFAPEREDIHTLFDRLELDDYVTFGGKG
jgi:hypothetical protein